MKWVASFAVLSILSILTFVAIGGCKKGAPKDEARAAPSVVVSTVAPPPQTALSVAPAASRASTTSSTVDAAAAAAVHCKQSPSSNPKIEDASKIGTSHDGKSKVWEETDPSPKPDEEHGKSYLCFERDGQRKVLLMTRAGRPDAGVEDELNNFDGFVFSRDDRVVFFTTEAWAVSGAAHGVEVATGKEWFIVDGSIIEELDHGPYKGSLYATHFRLDDQHPIGSPGYTGRGIVNTVVDWRGKTLKRLPDDELARKKVLNGN